MTMYGRHDLIGGQLAVSPDGHGGCGTTHKITAGPTGYAELTCAGGCENYLRDDPLWAAHPAEVGETFDEVRFREASEQHGQQNERRLMGLAMAKIAGLDGDAIFGPASPDSGELTATCPQGHPCRVSAKHCRTCGSPVTPPAAAPVAGTVQCEDGHEIPATDLYCEECGKPPAVTRKPRARQAAKAA